MPTITVIPPAGGCADDSLLRMKLYSDHRRDCRTQEALDQHQLFRILQWFLHCDRLSLMKMGAVVKKKTWKFHGKKLYV